MAANRWQPSAYERFIANWLQSRVPQADVPRNVRLTGSSGPRQIDVLVRATFPGLPEPETMVVECKAWSRPIPVGPVDALAGVMADVGVPLGMLVSPVGFTSGARQRAAAQPGLQLVV